MSNQNVKKDNETSKRIVSDADVVKAIMQQLRVRSAKDFAEIIGVSRQVISTILNGGTMSAHIKRAILSGTDVNPVWLDTGEGEIMNVPRAVEADYVQVLKKEIELKNEIIKSKDQTIMLLNKMLTERELLIDEKNRTIKLLDKRNMESIAAEEKPNYKAKPKGE